jgi:hypothetical protein
VDSDPIGIILVGPDWDPDLYPFPTNAEPNYTFQSSENYNIYEYDAE